MGNLDNILKGLQLLSLNDGSGEVAHDTYMLMAGNDNVPITPELIAEMETFGWHWDKDENCFYYMT